MRIVRQRSLLVFDNRVRNTSDHNHRHRSMCYCIDGRVFLGCRDEDFAYRNPAMTPNTPSPYHWAAYGLDCMASVGSDIWKRTRQKNALVSYRHWMNVPFPLAISRQMEERKRRRNAIGIVLNSPIILFVMMHSSNGIRRYAIRTDRNVIRFDGIASAMLNGILAVTT